MSARSNPSSTWPWLTGGVAVIMFSVAISLLWAGFDRSVLDPLQEVARNPGRPSDAPVVVEAKTLPPLIEGESSELRHSFEVRNPFAQPLTIDDVSKSCSCTELELSSKKVAPSAKAEMVVAADLMGRTGLFSSSVTVTHDRGRPWRYDFSALIYPAVKFTPSHVALGVQSAGEVITRSFRVIRHTRDLRDAVLPPKLRFTGQAAGVEISRVAFATRELGDRVYESTADFRLTLRLPDVATTEAVSIALDDGGDELLRADAKLQVQYAIEGPVVSDPKRLVLLRMADAVERRVIQFSRVDGAPLELESVSAGHEAVSCTAVPSRPGAVEVAVVVDPGLFDRVLVSDVVARFRDDDGSQIRVPIVASQ